MSNSTDAAVPACGLYRTVFPLPGNEAAVPANTLVYFHNHSEAGPPQVQLPETARHNRWSFHKDGITVGDLDWTRTLVPLPKEGFYTVTERLWIGGGQTFPVGLLMQLGYTRQGQPAAFPGVLIDGGTIRFQRRGAIVSDLQVETLQRSDFKLLTLAPQPTDGEAAPTADAPALEADAEAVEIDVTVESGEA